MMTLEEIRRKLQDRRVSIISRETGLHYNTVRDVRDGRSQNPSYRVIEALNAYLIEKDGTNG
jgi:hypothetical protein